MEQRAKRRNYKLRGKRVIEDKIISKESTPPKSVVPQAHSTPVESEMVTNCASESESDDGDEESRFCFTQDTMEVQWDYSNTPKGKEKKKLSKTKRKSKGGTFAMNKRRQEFSPIEAVKIRRRYVKEEPKADLTKLIAGLQALAEKVKEDQGLHKNKTQKELPSESCSTNNIVEHLNDDIQRLRGSRIVRKQLLAPSSPNPGLKEEVIPERVNENYTSLFDDDADDCMVRCSQEVEQKLHEPDPVNCVIKEKLSSDSVKAISSENSDLDENRLQNFQNKEAMGKESSKINQDNLSVDIQLEKEDYHLSDTQKLKESCILPTVPNSDLVKNVQHGINKSFIALFEDDADDCMVLCSQEIEKKLMENHIDKNVLKKLLSDDDSKISNTGNSSDKTIQTSYNKTKLDSAIFMPSSSNAEFDDSLDVLLQNFTEEDIDKLSQGVTVKKNVSSLTTNVNKHHFNNCENSSKSSLIAKTSNNYRIPVTNRSVHQIARYKQSKSFDAEIAANKLDGLTSSKTQCKVASVVCGSTSVVKLNRNTSALNGINNSGSIEKKLNTNSTVHLHCRTLNTGANNYLKAEIPNSFPKTSPQKCTPEEIERKRLEARKKLEMKKLSMMQERGRGSHPSKWQ